jgi:hypothetical protein
LRQFPQFNYCYTLIKPLILISHHLYIFCSICIYSTPSYLFYIQTFNFNAYVYLLFPLFQAILLTLTILSTTYFEIAVNFPTYFPERDNSFPGAEHKTQFTTESQNTSISPKVIGKSQFTENPYNGDVDANQRNLSRDDGSDVNNKKNGRKLNCIWYQRNSINDRKGTEAFKANRLWNGKHTDSALTPLCSDFNITCTPNCVKYFALRKIKK